MPASRTRVAALAVVVLLLALGAGLGWQRLRPSSASHVEMLAAVPARANPPPDIPTVPTTRAPAPEVATSMDAASVKEATPPSFDIVRVEPSGEALLAGRGKPNATVALVDRGRVVAEARTDAGGNFVMTPPALVPGDYALSLREGQGAAARDSKQSVVVSVPVSRRAQVVVAMAEPGKPTTLLSSPPQAAVPAGTPAATTANKVTPSIAPSALAIRSVELENGSGLFASGTAPPGTDVRVYLNDSRVADVIAAAAGAWTVKVRKGLIAGRYAVRADSLKPDQSVEARVEVPFEVPAASSSTGDRSANAAPKTAPSARLAAAGPVVGSAAEGAGEPSRADVIVDELKTEIVSRDDNLWRISRKRLGHGTRYTEIYAANVTQIRDPKLIFPGQVFVLPRD